MGKSHTWWWDSHMSPKNSRWLEESLKDMDGKVKEMLKLIEEDADSFAKRAEMYYKKRPELVGLVEEFYRSYRSLAERYDQLTGEIRKNMPEPVSPFGKRLSFKSKSLSSEDAEHSKVTKKKKKRSHGTSSSSSSSEDESDDDSEHRRLFSLQEDTDLEKKIQELQDELKNLEKENGLLQSQIASGNIAGDLKRLQEEITSLQKERHSLKDEVTATNDRLQNALKEMKSKQNEAQKLEHDLTKLSTENKGLIAELKKANKEIDVVLSEMELDHSATKDVSLHEMFKTLQQECSRFQMENQRLNEDVIVKTACIAELEGTVSQLTQESMTEIQLKNEQVQNLEGTIQKLEQSVGKLSVERETLVKDVAERKNELQVATDQVSQLTREIAALNSSALEQHKALQGEISCLKTTVSEHEATVQKKQDIIQKLEADMKQLHEELAHVQEESNTIHERGINEKHIWETSMKDLREEIDTLKGKVSSSNKCIGELERKSHELQIENQKLNSELSVERKNMEEFKQTSEKHIEELDSQQNLTIQKLDAQTDEMRDLDDKCRGAEQRILELLVAAEARDTKVKEFEDSLGSKAKELESWMEQISVLEQNLSSSKEEEKKLTCTIEAMTEQSQKMDFNLQELQESLRAAQQELTSLKEVVQTDEHTKASLEDSIMRMQEEISRLSELQAVVTNLEEEKATLSLEIENLQGSLSTVREKESHLSLKFEAQGMQIGKLQQELMELHKAKKALENLRQHGIDENVALEGRMKGLLDQIQQLQKENEKLHEKIQQLENQKEKLQERTQQLQDENEKLNSDLKNSKADSEQFCLRWQQERENLKAEMTKTNENYANELEKMKQLLEEKSQLQSTREIELASIKKTRYEEILKLFNVLNLQTDVLSEEHETRDVLTHHDVVEKKVSELQGKYLELKEQEARWQNEFSLKNTHLQEFEEEIRKLRKEKNGLDEDYQRSLEVQAKKSSDYEQQTGNLKSTIEELETLKKRRSEEILKLLKVLSFDKVAQLSKEEHDVTHDAVEKKVMELQAKHLELKEQEADWQREISLKTTQLQALEEEIGKLKKEKDALYEERQRSVEVEENKSSDYEKQIESLKSTVQELETLKRTRFDEILKLLNVLNLEKGAGVEKYETRDVTHDVVEKKVIELQGKYLELKEQQAHLQNKISSSNTHLKGLEEELGKLKQEKNSLYEEYQTNVNRLNETRSEEILKVFKILHFGVLNEISEEEHVVTHDVVEKMVTELQAKYVHLKEQEPHLQNEILSKTTHLQELEEEIGKLKQEKNGLHEEYQSSLNEISLKSAHLQEIEEEIRKLKQAKNGLHEEHQRILEVQAKSSSDYEQQIENLKLTIQELESCKTRHSKATSKLLNVLNVEKVSDLSEEDENDVVEKKLTELQMSYVELKGREGHLRDEISLKCTHVQELEEEIGKLKQEKDTLHEEHHRTIEAETKRSSDYQQQIESLKLKIQEIEEEKQKLDVEYQKITEDYDNVLKSLSCLQKEKEGLQRDVSIQISEVQKLQDEKTGFKNELSEFEEVIKSFHTENKNLEDMLAVEVQKYDEMQEKLAILEGENKSLLEESSKVREVQQELHSVQEENRVLKIELSKRDILVKSLEEDFLKLKDEKAELAKKVKAGDGQLNKMQMQLLELQEEDKRLKSKLNAVTEKVHNLEEKICFLEQENKNLLDKVEAGVKHSKTLITVLKFLRAEVFNVVQKAKTLRSEITESDLALKAKDAALSQLHAEMKKLQAEQERIAELNSQLSNKVTVLQEENRLRRAEIEVGAEEKREAIRQLCFSMNCMKDRNQKLEESLKNVKVRLRDRYNPAPVTWKNFLNPWYRSASLTNQ